MAPGFKVGGGGQRAPTVPWFLRRCSEDTDRTSSIPATLTAISLRILWSMHARPQTFQNAGTQTARYTSVLNREAADFNLRISHVASVRRPQWGPPETGPAKERHYHQPSGSTGWIRASPGAGTRPPAPDGPNPNICRLAKHSSSYAVVQWYNWDSKTDYNSNTYLKATPIGKLRYSFQPLSLRCLGLHD